MTVIWQVRYYLPSPDKDELKAYHDNESKAWRGKFLSRIRGLAQLPLDEWKYPLFRDLHRDCAGIGEMRFFVDKVQQRPLGFRSGPSEFTLLFFATEKSEKLVPNNACQIALGRKAEVLKDRKKTNAIWLALE